MCVKTQVEEQCSEIEDATRAAVEAECELRHKNALDHLVSWYEQQYEEHGYVAIAHPDGMEDKEREVREETRRMAEEIYATPTRGSGSGNGNGGASRTPGSPGSARLGGALAALGS